MIESFEPVGPDGFLVFKGAVVSIEDFTISVDDKGNLTSSMRPQIAWELWPMWLRVAIDHESASARARRLLSAAAGESDDARRCELIEDETRAGLVAISAAAFTLEAMARSAATRAALPAGIGRSASAARRITETIKQCFVVPPARFGEWRHSVSQIFELRNAAVHPDLGLRDPMPHPALRAAVPRPAHVYRLENVAAAVDTVLTTAVHITTATRPRLGRRFQEATAAWGGFGQELLEHRERLRR